MARTASIRIMSGGSLLLFAVLMPSGSNAQVSAPGFVAKPMLVSPITGVDDKEIALIDVSMEPGSSSPRHTHPEDCYGASSTGPSSLLSRARNRAASRPDSPGTIREARFITSGTSAIHRPAS